QLFDSGVTNAAEVVFSTAQPLPPNTAVRAFVPFATHASLIDMLREESRFLGSIPTTPQFSSSQQVLNRSERTKDRRVRLFRICDCCAEIAIVETPMSDLPMSFAGVDRERPAFWRMWWQHRACL